MEEKGGNTKRERKRLRPLTCNTSVSHFMKAEQSQSDRTQAGKRGGGRTAGWERRRGWGHKDSVQRITKWGVVQESFCEGDRPYQRSSFVFGEQWPVVRFSRKRGRPTPYAKRSKRNGVGSSDCPRCHYQHDHVHITQYFPRRPGRSSTMLAGGGKDHRTGAEEIRTNNTLSMRKNRLGP